MIIVIFLYVSYTACSRETEKFDSVILSFKSDQFEFPLNVSMLLTKTNFNENNAIEIM